jgi:hypothetical protein
METHSVPLPIQSQAVEIGSVVRVVQERGLALIATCDDVVQKAGREEPWTASHP